MTAESIAAVVADIRAGRIRTPAEFGGEPDHAAKLAEVCTLAAREGPIVDATALYRNMVDRNEAIAMYEDHPDIAPPFELAVVAHENRHGNVLCVCVAADGPERWDTANTVEWERVRWRISALVVIGGRGARGPIPTSGPMHMWEIAVYDDGEPADLHWLQLCPSIDTGGWDSTHLVLLSVLNFLNASNVELAEPQRPRSARRRLERTGVRVHEVVVRPVGQRRRSMGGGEGGVVPLTSVRGHWARYGERYGRGKLFGRLEGRFWVPGHARGSAMAGESHHDYRVEPE